MVLTINIIEIIVRIGNEIKFFYINKNCEFFLFTKTKYKKKYD